MKHRSMSSLPSRARLSAAIVLSLASMPSLHAQEAPPPTASEWGGIGLLQTPTARMADDGTFAFTASHNSPYSRYNITMQPFPWLEGSFRYINVSNLRYGVPSVSGDQNYKDKSIDFKIRLLQESRWVPALAFGVRDVGGTGLFSSEYIVANKNIGRFDASIGLATGYIGNRGDFSNPLGAIDDRFKTRPVPTSAIVNAGKFGASAMFRGPVGVFGGISYQTPWDAIIAKVEYDGNDYRNEPRGSNLRQTTPINVGLVYRPNQHVEVTAAWERGDAAMFSISLRGNPGRATAAPKPFDPPPMSISRDAVTDADAVHLRRDQGIDPPVADEPDWAAITEKLGSNASFRVDAIAERDGELIVSGYQTRFMNPAKSLGRVSRVLSSELGTRYHWYTVQTVRLGLPIVDTSIRRESFESYLDGTLDKPSLKRSVDFSTPDALKRTELYKPVAKPFGGGFSVGYRQNIGGPDGFILYQVAANYSATLFFAPDVWVTGTASQNLLNNYDKFKYEAPSFLPRVRTDLRQYMTTSELTLPNLQINISRRLGRDLYGIAYAGYLEWMYAGFGGEVLYRPIGEPWALGANLNWVKQRDYDQHFGLRDYSTTTGHATLYYSFDREERVIASLSAGRYLAGDYGATLNLARVFPNGMTMGAFASKTNVSSREFGEGSFDKGIYFSIPLDNVLPRSTGARATITWNPLVRDGAAMLARKHQLYNLTGERDQRYFFENIGEITD